MKTVEELAKEYQEKNFPHATGRGMARDIQKTYIDSYNKAHEWISVEDALPERREYNYKIVVKQSNDPDSFSTWLITEKTTSESMKYFSITHWKYID